MQLKHNNPMEKRTDLPSLFCMIGRHGPAVAVAVIAVVSVVAGFIIYRTVKGKRRKAEAGPGAGDVSGGSSSSSQGAPRDAVQPEKEPSPEHEASSRVESTDVCKEVSNAGDGAVIRSRRKLKNRRATAKEGPRSSSPLKEVKPEKLQNASKVEDASGVAQTDVEETIKSLQDGTCEVGNLNVEDEGYKHNLVERPNDAEGKHNGSLEPVVVSENLANEEKVQRSQKEEVTVEDVSTEIPCKDEENLCALNSPICLEENASVSSNGNYKLNQATSDSIKPEGYFEEPAVHMDESLSTKNEDEISVLGIAGLNKPHPASEDSQNVALQKHISNQHMTSPAIDCAISKQSPNSDATENNLVELSANCAVLLSSKELKLEQDSSTCSKNAEDVKMASFSESQETAVVLSHVPSCLSVEPETINHEYQALPLIGLLPEDKIKDVTSELAKATIDALCGLACPHSEVDETINGILVSKENVEILSSPDAAVGDVGSAASLPSRPDDNVLSSFQDQEGEQMQNADLEVPSDPAPVMAETVEPQPEEVKPIYENPWKLSWYDFGVESGISSMAVSPDLPDVESPLISEVLLPVTVPLPSEGQAELQTTMAESCAVIKEPTDAIPESSNDSQPHIKNTDEANDDSCTVSETCCEIESFNTTVGKLAKDATTDFCLNVDLGNMGTKIVIEGKREVEGKEEDKTTEINIMEATMDNNEWITDGTDQVLPWMKPPSSQINPVSIENVQVSSSVDVTCTHADVPPVNECEEDNTVPLSDEATEPGKRVLAVQPMPQNVSVTFQIHYLTHSPYQKVAIAGNHFELGNWKDFVPLEKVKDGFWATVVSLPAESHVEWKFVIVERGEVCRWEECGNRLLDTGNRETLLVHKCWGFL
ncbi:PREDICTED: starch-binding domain-containing protein 1 [Poecilia mexicana]|uniref:Starch-binding domain-containing protein 1 n=1 Tax=Poecilia mexicana TaxID=48701 RepID=A0A3B3X021_9TELE|nr:PREDICTED: starch-binding domain-containing protein 1 [Poecilia mexicana]